MLDFRVMSWGAAALLFLIVAACNREPLPETPPRQVTPSTFHYPEDLWDEGIEGQTILELFVTDRGTVPRDSIRVVESSGYAAFDSAAVRGAQQLRFEPARRGEDPVGVRVRLPVQFDMANAHTDSEGIP